MNTPRTRPLKRWARKSGKIQIRSEGAYYGIKGRDDYLRLIGEIAVRWPVLEEMMINVFANLLGVERFSYPLRQVYRSIVNAQIRILVMRNLLERAKENRSKGREYDDLIDEFAAINNLRNEYLHGLWSTEVAGPKRVMLAPVEPESGGLLRISREVKMKELEQMLARMLALPQHIREVTGSGSVLSPMLPKEPPQPRADNDS